MKIISKLKDYYDYYQGIFGIDTKKVLIRKDFILFEPTDWDYSINEYRIHLFAINNQIYSLVENKTGLHKLTIEIIESISPKNRYSRDSKLTELLSNPQTEINKERREPVVYGYHFNNKIHWQTGSPILKSFLFNKVLTAKEVYIEVETFMGYLIDNPEIKNNQTNKEKIVSNGFDLKTSFRGKIH